MNRAAERETSSKVITLRELSWNPWTDRLQTRATQALFSFKYHCGNFKNDHNRTYMSYRASLLFCSVGKNEKLELFYRCRVCDLIETLSMDDEGNMLKKTDSTCIFRHDVLSLLQGEVSFKTSVIVKSNEDLFSEALPDEPGEDEVLLLHTSACQNELNTVEALLAEFFFTLMLYEVVLHTAVAENNTWELILKELMLDLATHRYLCDLVGLKSTKHTVEEDQGSQAKVAVLWRCGAAERVERSENVLSRTGEVDTRELDVDELSRFSRI